VQGYL